MKEKILKITLLYSYKKRWISFCSVCTKHLLLSFKVLGDGVNRVGEVYWKGLENVGSAALGLGGAATDGVSRIGELASEGAATVGGLATNLVDAAATVPEGVMAVARYNNNCTECVRT